MSKHPSLCKNIYEDLFYLINEKKKKKDEVHFLVPFFLFPLPLPLHVQLAIPIELMLLIIFRTFCFF